MYTTKSIKNLSASAICLALCLYLPLLTAQNPELGQVFALMHIPVLLCGFVAGPSHAAAVGLIAPLLRFMTFGTPPIMPMGVAMCFELAAYGVTAGVLFMLLPKKILNIYISLIAAMIVGRAVFGIAFMQTFAMHTNGGQYTWEAFISGAFVTALPGIAIHIVVIPAIVIALKKAKLLAA
jgi:thiamine transporter ThiT